MTRLNQIVAVEKGIKTRSFQELTDAHHALQKSSLLSGISRTYRPKDEEGEQLPPESTRVQVKAEETIRAIAEGQVSADALLLRGATAAKAKGLRMGDGGDEQ